MKKETDPIPRFSFPRTEQLVEEPLARKHLGREEQLEAFVESLRRNKEEVLAYVDKFLHKPGKLPHELALGIYLDAALKAEVFDIDPFAHRVPGDEQRQDDRHAIACMATAHVAQNWLAEHPDSQPAQDILVFNLLAPSKAHHAFLRELWPLVLSEVTKNE
jgi:hypothetical protein